MSSEKKGIKHRKYVSAGITISIVLMLILSGPVGAVKLKVDIPQEDSSVKKGESVTFNVSATIRDSDTYVPIDSFTVKIIGDTNKEIVFSTDGKVISGDGVTVTPILVPDPEDHGYGNRSGYDENDDKEYAFGYGYGFRKEGAGKDLEFIYEITLDTSSFNKGNYEVAFILNTGDSGKPTFESVKTSFEVTTTTTSGGGGRSSGGGGGGGGGSPEPASNVRIKELAQQFVTNGNRIRFDFIRKATIVDYVEFDAKKSVGKTTTIIEELKEISVLTPEEPEGEIYEHINIWVGNGGFATPQNIGSAVVGFRVNKTWITENEIIESTITLNRYSEEKWSALQTRKIGEDEGFIYFEASTLGFSPFAVTAKNKKLVIEEKEGEEGEVQASTGTEQTVESETPAAETEESSGEKEKSGISKSFISKAFSFIIGFMVVILIGMAVMEKRRQ